MPESNGSGTAANTAKTRTPLEAPPPGEERLPELARKAERAFYDNVDRLRSQSLGAAHTANEQFEQARVYVVERMQQRPLTTTLSAVGIGFVLGVLFAGGRR